MNLEYVRKELANPKSRDVMNYLHKEVTQGWLVLYLLHVMTHEQYDDLKIRIRKKIGEV